jgi:hypothetical protein
MDQLKNFLQESEQQEEINKPIQITLPRMSFEMNSISYDATRKTTVTQTFKALENGKLKKVLLPVPIQHWNLS